MKTSSLFVEIVVAGIQSTLFLGLLLCVVFDWYPTTLAYDVSFPQGILLFIILGISYPLGTISDKIADTVFTLILNPVLVLRRFRIIKEGEVEAHVDEWEAFMAKVEKEFMFLRYLQHRMRIVRTTALHCALIAPLAGIYVYNITPNSDYRWLITFITIILILTIAALAFFCLGILQVTFERRFNQAKHQMET